MKHSIKNKILKLVAKKDYYLVSDLEHDSKIPRTTLLRYLKSLENLGSITKTHGEVTIRKSANESLVFPRINSFAKEKRAIVQNTLKVANIKNGEIIFIDSGSTNYYFAKQLKLKNVVIYTNSFLFSLIINPNYQPKVHILPGKVNPSTLAIASAETIIALNKIKFDKAFIGFNSFDEHNLYTTNQEEALVKKTVISNTFNQDIYFIGRESKKEAKSKFLFANLNLGHLMLEKGAQ